MNAIKAAIPCAAVKDIRYYLQGALFEYDGAARQLRIVSTDGNIMSCFSLFYVDSIAPSFSVIIPLDTLKAAAKEKRPALELMETSPGRYALGAQLFKPVGGRYPDYRRVIPVPGSLNGESGDYSPALLERAISAMRAFRKTKDASYHLIQNGKRGSAVMHDGFNDAMVVVMPWLTNAKDLTPPAYQGFN
jgi:hypothetical protein